LPGKCRDIKELPVAKPAREIELSSDVANNSAPIDHVNFFCQMGVDTNDIVPARRPV
jgi:hypothetical protein